MTTKTATLTHKVRNPQNLDLWLNIWEADVSADYDNNNRNNESIVIKPSENWQIPITQLTDYIDNTTNPPIIVYNVTTTGGTENYLAKFKANGEITDGPAINPANGGANKFLNEKGEWAPALTAISGAAGITVDGTTIKHSNSEISSGTVGTYSETDGSTLTIPYITYDNYGHITATGTHTHNITGFLTSNGTDTINGARVTGPNSLAVSVINSTDLNNTIRAKLNTQEAAGVVAAGENGLSSVWSTDGDGKPAWRQITNDLVATDAAIKGNKIADNSISGSKLNTKLLGVWIDDMPPSMLGFQRTLLQYIHSESVEEGYVFSTYSDTIMEADSVTFYDGFVLDEQIYCKTDMVYKSYELIQFNFELTCKYENTKTFTIHCSKVVNDPILLNSKIINRMDWISSRIVRKFKGQNAQDLSNQFSTANITIEDFKNNTNDCVITYIINPVWEEWKQENFCDANAMVINFGTDDSNKLNSWDYEHCGIWVEI